MLEGEEGSDYWLGCVTFSYLDSWVLKGNRIWGQTPDLSGDHGA